MVYFPICHRVLIDKMHKGQLAIKVRYERNKLVEILHYNEDHSQYVHQFVEYVMNN